MEIQRQGFLSIDQLKDRYLEGSKNNIQTIPGDEENSFRQILERKKMAEVTPEEGLKFSKHASSRLSDRGIELSEGQMERLQDGVQKARQKGIRDSLVIVDELAFIVNVPNQTVVTAMTGTDANERIFTNINGAVIN